VQGPPGQQLPGQQLLGEQLPGEQLPGEQLPGEQLPGEQLPGEQLPSVLLPALLRPGADLVVVDVETTGWLADAARITEIGAVRMTAGVPTAEFSALVNPGMPIPPDISALTGITDSMVAGAPAIGAVLPDFLAFSARAIIVAHNAPFDIGFLTAECEACGIAWPQRTILDTAVLSRMVLLPHEVADHRLATLSGHFATATGPCHRALADARATAEVLTGLLRLLSP
jgi:DNA polymerase III subunit epsilon